MVAAIALIVSHDAGTIAGMSNDQFARLVAGMAIVIFLGGAVTSSYRGRILQAIKHMVSWAAALIVLVGLYAYRVELSMVADRVIGELTPQGSQINVTGVYGTGQAVRIKRGWTGHFDQARALIERANDLNVGDPNAEVLDHLGDVYWRLDRRDDARAQWRQALAADPDVIRRRSLEQKLARGLTERAPRQRELPSVDLPDRPAQRDDL
jgi:tetratricopeptide (TPR) repeat protein